MPVKSVKVKLYLAEMPNVEQGIWQLHSTVNTGVRYYTEWLSLLRQGNLYRRSPKDDGSQECYMTADDCKDELLKRLRVRQKQNGHAEATGSDDELLAIARQLYEALVPQSVGAKGEAQQLASNFLSPLADVNSRGGLGEAKSGRKPRWQAMRDEGSPGWEEAKAKYEAKKADDPAKNILLALESYHLRPLFDVFTESRMSIVHWKPLRKRQGVRSWDRDMFQQSIERLMSWETWNQRVGEEYAKLIAQRDRFMGNNFVAQENLVELIKELEEEMKKVSHGLQSVEVTAHQVTKRALRGIDRVIEKWTKFPVDAPFALYDEVLKKVQGQNSRKFGSHDLFAKLAEPNYQPLWREDASFITRYAVYNSIIRKIDHAKQFATFTLPNACTNPIWTRFENDKGKNIHTYDFLFNHFGVAQHAVRFQRLLTVEDGIAREVEDVIVPIAPSKQLDKLLPGGDRDSSIDLFVKDNAAPRIFHGEFGGAKIQYVRKVLERKRRRDQFEHDLRRFHVQTPPVFNEESRVQAAKEVGHVFFNLSVRVQTQSELRGDRRPPYATLFRIIGDTARTYVNNDRLTDYIQAYPDQNILGSEGLRSGLRVMSVDLGVRTSASISVFRVATRDELQKNSKGRSPFFYAISGTDNLVAIHERSQLLKLPGETESKELRRVREQRSFALNRLHSQLTVLRLLVRCGTDDLKVRSRRWDRLNGQGRETALRATPEWRDSFLLELTKLEALHGICGDEDWIQAVDSSVKILWRYMGKQVKDWRKDVKSGNRVKVKGFVRDAVGGNSIGQIDYLEKQYRFLKSWTYFGKVSGQVNRAERGSQFAIALREHIDHAKEDRLKKLADRMIMEALGYVYQAHHHKIGGWVAKYPPCQLILLEELSEYRFNNDRPPSENNQLMQWSHRGVLQELKNQAVLHDVLIGTMYSAFSSRFDARTGAPGVRCRRVPARFVDNEQEKLPMWLSKFLEGHGIERTLLQADDLIPTGDGEFFVAPLDTGNDDFRQVHADINAAQNLQKRLWQDFDISEIRLRCERTEEDEEVVLVPSGKGKRVTELYKNSIFVSENNVTFSERQRGGKRKKAEIQNELTEEELELLLEADEAREKSTVIIRDPSRAINHGQWTSQLVFWSNLNKRIEKYLLDRIRSRKADYAKA